MIIDKLRDPDVLQYLKFLVLHPSGVFKLEAASDIPHYLRDNEITGMAEIGNVDSYHVRPITDISEGTNKIDYDNAEPLRKQKVHLAGMDVMVDLDAIDWRKNFSDPEDMAALHRFIWLYKMVWCNVSPNNKAEYHNIVINAIHSWIDIFGGTAKGHEHFEIWQTYTVSERIINWCILLGITSDDFVKDAVIVKSLIDQLNYIKGNFEYFGEKVTGNHFCNNGRALYIAGSMLRCSYYAELGKTIISNEYDRVIVDDGFLREGSSHYQFLFTKWFADIYWIAGVCGDYEFQKQIGCRLRKLIEGCIFFLTRVYGEDNTEQWTIPYIGDISPDYPPEWLMGVPWAAAFLLRCEMLYDIPKGVGYHTFFLKGVSESENQDSAKHKPFKKSLDYGRMGNDMFTVFCHVNHSIYPNNLPGHFHHDTCSLILYANKSPLFIDCGRFSYETDVRGMRGKNFSGHCILIIDGMNPEINMRVFFDERFLKEYAGQAPEMEILENGNQIKMMTEGYRRISGVGKYSRIVTIEGSSVSIEDLVEGNGIHDVLLLYHVTDDTEIKIAGRDSVFLDNGGKSYHMCFSEKGDDLFCIRGDRDKVYGHYAVEYGHDGICKTLLYRKRTAFPYNINTVLKML